MRTFWKRLNYFTHTRVFLRVIPVVFVTVLAVGAFSLAVFLGNLNEQSALHHQNEMDVFESSLRHRASLEAMTIESWKEKSWSRIGGGPGWAPEQLEIARQSWLEHVTEFPLVGAAALVSAQGTSTSPQVRRAFRDSLNNVANHRILDAWLEGHRDLLLPNLDLASWCRTHRPEELLRIDGDLFHTTYLLPPVLVQVSEVGASRAGRSSRHALLPVLVRNRRQGGRSDPMPGAESDRAPAWSEASTHGVFFLDLNALVQELPLQDWWCALGQDGLVLGSRTGMPYAGIHLCDQPELNQVGIFDELSGADLNQWIEAPWTGTDSQLIGWRQTPWMVTASRPGKLPMSLLIARPASGVKAVAVRYIVAILAVALVALLGSFIGIAQVMKPFSLRLNSVSHNMERLAEGDYSIRMQPGRSNEVEQLVAYFNTMAGSLDETNRQLGEKTGRLATALHDLRALDKAKDDFLVLISHEVRTPLTSIMGGIDYLKSTIGRCEESLREALESMNLGEITEIMDHSAGRLRDFMNDAIQMISIQNTDRELKLQAVPAGELLSACLTPLRERIEQRGLELEFELADEGDWELLCDVEVLQVALGRILDNAIVHNEAGGRIRLTEAEFVPDQGPTADLVEDEGLLRLLNQAAAGNWDRAPIEWHLIEVFNTGPAIPESRQQNLFSKFQIVGEIEHHQKGSGLSLPIALAAIEHHGGRIFLVSRPEFGNSFYLLLPGVPAGTSAAPVASVDQQGDGVGSAAVYEEVGQVAHSARLEIEFDDSGAGAPGGGNEPSRRIHGPGRTDYEEKVTLFR